MPRGSILDALEPHGCRREPPGPLRACFAHSPSSKTSAPRGGGGELLAATGSGRGATTDADDLPVRRVPRIPLHDLIAAVIVTGARRGRRCRLATPGPRGGILGRRPETQRRRRLRSGVFSGTEFMRSDRTPSLSGPTRVGRHGGARRGVGELDPVRSPRRAWGFHTGPDPRKDRGRAGCTTLDAQAFSCGRPRSRSRVIGVLAGPRSTGIRKDERTAGLGSNSGGVLRIPEESDGGASRCCVHCRGARGKGIPVPEVPWVSVALPRTPCHSTRACRLTTVGCCTRWLGSGGKRRTRKGCRNVVRVTGPRHCGYRRPNHDRRKRAARCVAGREEKGPGCKKKKKGKGKKKEREAPAKKKSKHDEEGGIPKKKKKS